MINAYGNYVQKYKDFLELNKNGELSKLFKSWQESNQKQSLSEFAQSYIDSQRNEKGELGKVSTKTLTGMGEFFALASVITMVVGKFSPVIDSDTDFAMSNFGEIGLVIAGILTGDGLIGAVASKLIKLKSLRYC